MRALQLFAFCAMATMGTTASAQEIDWQKVDEALGRTAAVSGDVHRYGFPRTDLQVTLDGVTIKPTLALGGWVAFKPMHGGAMVMGDLVLLETEINPVMAKLIESGLEITAVHNHLLRGEPCDVLHARRRTRRSREDGDGDPRRAWRKARRRSAPAAAPRRRRRSISTPRSSIRSSASRDRPMAASTSSACRAAIPVTEGGMQLAPAGPMGVATAINFQPTGGGKAAITGDFVLTGDEVNPVIKALRDERHRGHGDPQPHADRAAASDLHALLGQRRRGQARQGTARRARQDREREELSCRPSERRDTGPESDGRRHASAEADGTPVTTGPLI